MLTEFKCPLGCKYSIRVSVPLNVRFHKSRCSTGHPVVKKVKMVKAVKRVKTVKTIYLLFTRVMHEDNWALKSYVNCSSLGSSMGMILIRGERGYGVNGDTLPRSAAIKLVKHAGHDPATLLTAYWYLHDSLCQNLLCHTHWIYSWLEKNDYFYK